METMVRVVSPRVAGELLGVTTLTIYAWIKIGKLSAYRLPSGYLRIREDDLHAFLTPVSESKRGAEPCK